MATYAIGDLQGCLDPLKRLLDKIEFDAARDRLLFVGDLVNRGPQSLETLRFIRALGTSAATVLGNHDLHLLAVALSGRKSKGKDTLGPILKARDRDELIDWLRRQPLALHEPELNSLVVHAGIPPAWDLDTALRCAREVETVLQGEQAAELLGLMYSDHPDLWDEQLQGLDRCRYIINALSRMRYLTRDGRMEFKHKCVPHEAPPELVPWYECLRADFGPGIIFGHWSTLGRVRLPGALALDTGCLWGGKLSAIRLDAADQPLSCEDCAASIEPRLD